MTGQQAGSVSGAGGDAAAAAIDWFIGRDGQQYGPVADAEFRKLFASGQVLPTDLVWREGFPEWRPASTLRPAAAPQPNQAIAQQPSPVAPRQQPELVSATHDAAIATPGQQPAPQTARREQQRVDAEDDADEVHPESTLKRRGRKFGRGLAWSAILLFFVITLGSAYLMVAGDKNLLRMATAMIPSFGERIATTAPIGGFATTPDATDAAMQRSLLWQVLKKNHAEWYADRVKEATAAARSQKPDAEIAATMMQAVATLRRQHAGDAASAPIIRLKSIASLFATNLARLKTHSVDACYQYVSTGESAPAIVALLQSPEHTSALQAQLVATFEGINEGRRSPRVYPQPNPGDYDALVTILEGRGWKKQDMRLFSDSQALAKAPPETVCKLVTEWFESQLAIKEPDTQMRLIVDSLRPVVAG